MELFEALSRIPRCSGSEAAAGRWVAAWAQARGFACERDPAGNVRVVVPATRGAESAPGVVLQGHLDMVCEKTPDSPHDFARDPIRLRAAGDWLGAEGTTLGADNGVAVALALAVVEDASAVRPPLELLFTVEEETGLRGARRLAPGWLTGRRLINLDAEEEGVITIGCAGGRDLVIRRGLDRTACPAGLAWRRLAVGGLEGGHSGIDIHRGRANAIKLLARVLNGVFDSGELLLGALAGGTRANAIPRDAWALLGGEPPSLSAFEARAASFHKRLREEFPGEPRLSLALAPAPPPADVGGRAAVAPAEAALLVRLLLALPHGVAELSPEAVVHTSNNLATVGTAADGLEILTSQRSLTAAGLEAMSATVAAVARLAGAATTAEAKYPPWPPDPGSPLLERCRSVYRELRGKPPEVRAIHAGIECAVIGSLTPGMEMVAIGPTTENAHSPGERLNLPSLGRLYDFLKALLASLAADRPAAA
jgi:dipeptidase D